MQIHPRKRHRRLEHVEALRVGLHQGVLDPVVDHLGEVTGAFQPSVHQPTTLGGQRLEDRSAVLKNLRLSADHQ